MRFAENKDTVHNITTFIQEAESVFAHKTDGAHADTVSLCCCLLGETSFIEECPAELSQASSFCSTSQTQYQAATQKAIKHYVRFL